MVHAEKMLWKTQVTFQVFVLVNLQPNLQKMTKHFYDIKCLPQMLCIYKATKTHLKDLVIISGVCVLSMLLLKNYKR